MDGEFPVTFAAFVTLLPMLLGIAGFGPGDQGTRVRSVYVEQHLVIRVPVRAPRMRVQWTVKKGPKCIRPGAIRAAFSSSHNHVDFVLAGRHRVRALLDEDCPALDFYEGFYLSPEDERICARRDVIRSRMGGSCRISRFVRLVPKPRG